MLFRQRVADITAPSRLVPVSVVPGDQGAVTRAAAERWLSEADHAIDTALSVNSEQFLRESRQPGGQ